MPVRVCVRACLCACEYSLVDVSLSVELSHHSGPSKLANGDFLGFEVNVEIYYQALKRTKTVSNYA